MPAATPVHFISGLPRAGSTLLAALLAQNPALLAHGRISPITPMMIRLDYLLSRDGVFGYAWRVLTEAFDRALGTPDLHRVRPVVSYKPRMCILPSDIVTRLQSGMFWRSAEALERGAQIIA